MTTQRLAAAALACSILLPTATPAAELPANTWVKVDDAGGGVRRGSATAWLAKEKKFLVVGGAFDNPRKKIARKYTVQTFDPAGAAWAEVKPEGLDLASFKKTDKRDMLWKNDKGRYLLNSRMGVAGSSVFDPTGRKLYVFQTSVAGKFIVAGYDVDARKWRLVSDRKPPAKADGEYPGEWGTNCVFLEGTSAVLDPVNQELLFIGGRIANADDYLVNNWALSLKGRTWHSMGLCHPFVPCRWSVLRARTSARDAMAAARNVYYAGTAPADQAKALRPAVGLLTKAIAEAGAIVESLGGDKSRGWEGEATRRAKELAGKAAVELKAAEAGLGAGKLDAALIRKIFDAAWTLDEAAEFCRAVPGPRMHAAVGYDADMKSIVVFGGDHGDYLLSDTWVYDCPKRQWRRVFPTVSPPARRARGRMLYLGGSKKLALVGGATYVPRFIYFRRTSRQLADVWTFDVKAGEWSLAFDGKFKEGAARPALTCRLAAGDDDVILGLSSTGRYTTQWDGTTWLMRVGGARDAAAAKKLGVEPGRRTYFSVVPQYDPCWYDAAPPPDPKAAEAWLAKLKPNTWTAVPRAPRAAPKRSWGTAVFDPDRDQFYHWTGGHQADPASIVSTYHPGVHRWSIPYVAEYAGKGFGFNGRPDCMNHTYLNYAYDTVSKKLICTASGGTGVYDPDRREFVRRVDQPFSQHPYYTKLVGTPRGVICWTRGWLGILDVKQWKWTKLPAKGKFPRSVHGDENTITYDPKRDCLWLMAADGYQKMNGQIWRYDLGTAEVRTMDPAAAEAIGKKVRPREAVYLPALDLVLYNGFADNRQAAYDPAKNRWVTLAIAKNHKTLGGVEIGLMHDPKRDLVWAMDGGQRMFVLKIDPKTLDVRASQPSP